MEVDRVHLEDATMPSFRTLFVYRTLRTRKQIKNKLTKTNIVSAASKYKRWTEPH